ncbi:MAG TPA: lactonase family protein [Ohtaekwangia sp.]|uniref:lactonase family protein n=1 Tax=Ohtaekwangia sp. TaxID=2066019 RepID=UPI002F95B7F4
MTRRLLLLTLFSLSYIFICAQPKKEILYVGTFSVRGSQGIYSYTFNRAKKTLTPVQNVPGLESPSFLGIHPTRKFLYSVNRGKASENETGGSVTAYQLDAKTGKLTALNTRSSFGADPCHISFDKTGQYIFVSNYNEGNLVVLPLFEDGLVGNPSDSKKYIGNSINTERQQSSHLHSALISPDNHFLYAADLGTDKIYIYNFNLKNGTLDDSRQKEVSVKPGCGPRHFVFHPNGNYMYVAEELTSTVATFKVDKKNGDLTILQDSVLSLPKTFTGKNTSADIHIDPKGKFLYMSNRGYNGLSIFSVGADGKIKLVGQQTTGGSTPRNFMIDSKGEYIFVAHQDSDTIVMFRINPKTGMLAQVGKPVKVPAPVCLKMITLP